jgi:site-specific DNA-methyltransferase (adenine-specific)
MSVAAELEPRLHLEIGRIHQGDCLDLLQQIESGTIDLVFADPPFNIGYQYDQYHDRQDDEDYVAWSRAWMDEVHRVLKPNGTFWLAIGDEYAAELKFAAKHQLGFHARSWVVWYYTFGVNCTRKFSRSHAHLLHFTKDESDFTFNAEDPQVRVPSARALVYADKRANPAGRLPDDTWVLRPQDLPEGFQPTDDTWYYARVAGTFSERQGFHGCQMPEQLLGRIIRVSSDPGDVVLDPFAGSGTTLAVAKKLGRRWLGCEISADYARAATERLDAIEEGEPLSGPADPIASAPATANGRRLGERGGAPRQQAEMRASAAASDTPRDDSASIAVAAPSAFTQRTLFSKRELCELIRDAVVDAFHDARNGHGVGWLLANPALQNAFHARCREAGLIGGPADWNRELLRLRKAGELPKRDDTKKVSIATGERDEYDFAAEIAWRLAADKFAGASLEEILCDPDKAAFFDRAARRFAPGFGPPQYRWAALRLRKERRRLAAEVKKYHFIFATRDFRRFQSWARCDEGRHTGQPGIYLLRGEEKTPLFIARTLDLGRRLATHDACPAATDVVEHVAILPVEEMPGEAYQAAFTADLIQRYRPRWNLALASSEAAAAD